MNDDYKSKPERMEQVLKPLKEASQHIRAMQGFNIVHGIQPKRVEDEVVKLKTLYGRVNTTFLPLQLDVLREMSYTALLVHSTCQALFSSANAGRQGDEDEEVKALETLTRAQMRSDYVFGTVIAVSDAMKDIARSATQATQEIADKASRDISALEANIKNTVDNQNASMERAVQDVKQYGETVRKDTAQAGISEYADFFKEQADTHKSAMRNWLIASGFAGGALVLALGLSFFFLDYPQKLSTVIQFAVTKTLLFSALAYALFFCVKNYMAHRHNHVVNNHRFNALKTYRAIVAGTNPEGSAHDIVLAQAAYCIFAPQSTGYAKDIGSDKMNVVPVDTREK